MAAKKRRVGRTIHMVLHYKDGTTVTRTGYFEEVGTTTIRAVPLKRKPAQPPSSGGA